ncbi:MAG: RteC domain-containing protein [Saprospiraceae bacterium]|nr:RteC domain-containing protein [Saprospiraceae bacterium]
MSRLHIFIGFSDELAEHESSYTFVTLKEEIDYYKYEKPRFQKYGIFYNKLLAIELNVPMGSKKVKKAHYDTAYENISTFYNENQELITYYRLKSTEKDHRIFTRNSLNNHIFALIEAASMMEEFYTT